MGFGVDTEAYFNFSINASSTMKLKPATSQTAIAAAFDLWSKAACLPMKLRPQASFSHMEVSRYWQHTLFSSCDPAFFTTADGLPYLDPSAIKVGNTIALFNGSRLPFVLMHAWEMWSFRELAYIHAMMYDELKQLEQSEAFVEEEFGLC